MAIVDHPDAARIGAFLRSARERQGEFSQEQAAREVGTTVRNLGSWERGVHVPPTDRFLALVLLYKADVLELLARRPKSVGGTSGQKGEGERNRRAGSDR